MTVFLNGRFVPEERAAVSVFDRGFLYGDGLFETMRVCAGQPFRWKQHLDRLRCGAAFLNLPLAYSPGELERAAARLIALNRMPDALLRLVVSRGTGPRGYSPRGAEQGCTVLSLHPAPAFRGALPRWRLVTASLRVPAGDPLTGLKTCNKLPQVLARAEADRRGANDALLLNTHGRVAEATGSNVFWIERGAVCTPPLNEGPLPGVTRAAVLELCDRLGLGAREVPARPAALARADAVFLTLSSWGVVEVVALDGEALGRSPVVATLRRAYEELVRRETKNAA
jgi:aminodeoxychorismate lyase